MISYGCRSSGLKQRKAHHSTQVSNKARPLTQLMCKDHGPWCSNKGLEEENPSCLDVRDSKIG